MLPNKLSSHANPGQRISSMTFALRMSWGLRFGGGLCLAEQPQSGCALGKRVVLSLEKAKAQNCYWISNSVLPLPTGGRRGQCEHPFYCGTLLWVSLRSAHACLLGMIRLSSLPRLSRAWTICYHRCSCYTSAGQCFWTMTLGFKHLQTIIAHSCLAWALIKALITACRLQWWAGVYISFLQGSVATGLYLYEQVIKIPASA